MKLFDRLIDAVRGAPEPAETPTGRPDIFDRFVSTSTARRLKNCGLNGRVESTYDPLESVTTFRVFVDTSAYEYRVSDEIIASAPSVEDVAREIARHLADGVFEKYHEQPPILTPTPVTVPMPAQLTYTPGDSVHARTDAQQAKSKRRFQLIRFLGKVDA